ncbi:MAG: hypothetical protein GX620_05505 [Chloroflexi bacterium]|nr:hypothetical protein [Chloroflexota bacterium]
MVTRTWKWRLPTLFVSLVLLGIGLIGPWIPHRTAALTVTGLSLVEFAKFFPEVQAGTVGITRALFVLPLITLAVELGLLIHGSVNAISARIVATGAALLVALGALPPYQFLREPDYRLQLGLAIAGLLLVLLAIPSSLLPSRTRGALVSAVALAGIAPATLQFLQLHPLVEALYKTPLPFGWGAVLCWISGLGLIFTGFSAAFSRDQRGALG